MVSFPRAPKPLRWTLKLIRTVYNDKFVQDAVDNRYHHPHDPMPPFVHAWTVKRYGLRNLVEATRSDLDKAINTYDDIAEVRLFGGFLRQEYDTEQLTFFLYARTVIQDQAATSKAIFAGEQYVPQMDSTLPVDVAAEIRHIPLKLAHDLVTSTFGERFSQKASQTLLVYVDGVAEVWLPSGKKQQLKTVRPGSTVSAGPGSIVGYDDGAPASLAVQSLDEKHGQLMVNEARFLELLLQAYTADRDEFMTQLKGMFAAADGDSDGEIDIHDFVNLMSLAIPEWSASMAKQVNPLCF
jgi:hypothetical protein